MELYLEMEIPCKLKYDKLLLEITTDIFLLEGIELKSCTFEQIRGIILENIEENSLKYSIFKQEGICWIKIIFSNGKEETINLK